MKCQELRQIIDSYLSDELLVETNHDVHRHLEDCTECRKYLTVSRKLRSQVKRAVIDDRDASISVDFASRLRTDLERSALQSGVWQRLSVRFGAAKLGLGFATALLIIAVGCIYFLRPSETNNVDIRAEAQKTGIEHAVQTAWADMTEHAVGDHKDCAVKFALAEIPMSLDEAAKLYGPVNKDLDRTVFTAVKAGFASASTRPVEFVEAHSCIFKGRRFAHVVIRIDGKLVSVLITDTDLPADDTINESMDGTLNAASFSIDHHAVFVVSEMTADLNRQAASALYPEIRRHIAAAGA